MKTHLEIAIAGQASQSHPIERRAVVGAGPGADVVVAAPGVEAQHFRLVLAARHLELRLAPGVRPLRYEGKPFSGGRVAYERDFYLEQVRFNCAAPGRGQRRAPWPWLLALAAAGAGGSVMLEGARIDAHEPTREGGLVLFGDARCPEPEPEAARRHAQRSERAAQAKLERRRYDPHDGVAAGRLYAEAAACFATAGDQAERERSERVGGEVRALVMEELRAAQLRLRAALGDEQHQRALEEIAGLRRLLRDEPDPYGRWLEEKERELRGRLQAKR
jgi:hypothetical protein